MSHLPATMNALVVEEAGGPFVAKTLPLPVAGAGQVLVRVAASGVNPLDAKVRAGKAGHAEQPLPAVLGMDMAGVVAAVGEGVDGFVVGDAVFGMVGGIGGLQGTLAEYVAADARLIAKKPAGLTMREAAALPLSVITAWEGLVDRANVHAGQAVLVHGGAGGVGHVAVQLAVARGGRVYATGSAGQFALLRGYGAEPIDYRASTVDEYVQRYTAGEGFDIVYDTVGGATLDASFAAARLYGGHVLSILGWGTHSLAPLSFRAATYSGVFTLLPLLTGKHRAHHGDILREAARMAEAGQIVPRLDDAHFTLETALDAHALVESGRAQGKVVVDIASLD